MSAETVVIVASGWFALSCVCACVWALLGWLRDRRERDEFHPLRDRTRL